MRDHPDARAEPWPHYASAVIELIVDGRHLVLTPSEDADGATDMSPLAPWGGRIIVLAAGDPYPAQFSPAENEARLRSLCAELDAAGVEHRPALGRSTDGSTCEVSRALRGIGRARALAFAARFDQLAVYDIDDRIRCVAVESGDDMTVRRYSLEHARAGSDAAIGPTGWRG